MSQPFTSGDGFLASASRTPMDESDIIANLRAERDALAERLRLQPDLRDIVGHLRALNAELQAGAYTEMRVRIADLLRRLDESQ